MSSAKTFMESLIIRACSVIFDDVVRTSCKSSDKTAGIRDSSSPFLLQFGFTNKICRMAVNLSLVTDPSDDDAFVEHVVLFLSMLITCGTLPA